MEKSNYQGGSTPGMNQALGLPFDKMKKIAIAFDVDGTLIDSATGQHEWPNSTTINLLGAFIDQKWKNVDIIVWSGGGAEYAEVMARKWLRNTVGVKFYSKLQHEEIRQRYHYIIAIDDIQDTALGDANLIVRNK